MGYSSSVSAEAFLPLDAEGQIHTMMLFQQPLVTSEAMRELVKLGVKAVPHLIEHLGDQRETKIAPVFANFGIGAGCDFNRRVQKEPRISVRPSESEGAYHPQRYTIKVGDLCFVALGQIVNRDNAVVRYIPSGIVSVRSPTRFRRLRAVVKADCSELTPEKHEASLLADFHKPDNGHRLVGAAKRLAYYYPETKKPCNSSSMRVPT
jgi:hypothetical protein